MATQLKSMQELHLQGNRFTARGLQALLQALRAPIRSLDMSHASLGGGGLLGMLRSHSTLSRLAIAYTGLTDAVFATLVTELPTSIVSLNARGTLSHSTPPQADLPQVTEW